MNGYRYNVEGITTTTDFMYPPGAFIGTPAVLNDVPEQGGIFGVEILDRDHVLPAGYVETWFFAGAQPLPITDGAGGDVLPDDLTVHRLHVILALPHGHDGEQGRHFAEGFPYEPDRGPLGAYVAKDRVVQVAVRCRDAHPAFASATALKLGVWIA